MSNSARWIIATVCAVLGVIALIYAVIYLSVGIHSLPGFVPGKQAGVYGHYHKRAALTGVIGIVLLAIAIFVGMGARRSSTTRDGSTPEPAAGPAPGADKGQGAGDDGDAVRS
jgi:uncharacterized membrane protein